MIIGDKKFAVGTYLLIIAVVLMLILVVFLMLKYNVEGETKPPFKISKIIVTSGAKTINVIKGEEGYSAEVIQNNDIKIAIEKNSAYKKEAKIKNITINNIQISEAKNIDKIAMYRPSKGIDLFDYQEESKVNESLVYVGDAETDLKADDIQISNQGGIIEISVSQSALGTINYTENERIAVDGTMLSTVGKSLEDLTFKLSFDMIIELEEGLKLKTTIKMDLPKGNIIEDGIETFEQSDFKAVFKRI